MSECKDYVGKIYKTEKEMSKAYGLPYETFKSRKKRGWTIEKILLTPVQKEFIHGTTPKQCTDHLGNVFPSISAKCRNYGISRSLYQDRIKKGYSEKDALTSPIIPKKKSVDYRGVHYCKLNDFLEEYNLSMSDYYNAIKLDWSLDDLVKGTYTFDIKDHLGNSYKNLKEMLEHYNVSYKQYFYRSNLGMPLSEILENPDNLLYTKVVWNDILYDNVKTLCKVLKLSYPMVTQRLRQNWTIEEALTIPKNMYIGEYRVAECLKKLNVKFYHDCSIKTIFKDLQVSINWNDFISELKHNLENAGFNWSKSKIEKLRPDFVLYTDDDNKIKGIIEFDGEQHQNFVEFFFKTIEEFYRRSDADFVKQSLWEYFDIPMLRIRHDQLNMIDDMIKDFIDNPQNYIHNHNTYLSEDEYWSILSEEKAKLELAFAS